MRQPGAWEIALGLCWPDDLSLRAQPSQRLTVHHPSPIAFERAAPRSLRRFVHPAGARAIVISGYRVVHVSTLPRPTDVRFSPIDAADAAARAVRRRRRAAPQR